MGRRCIPDVVLMKEGSFMQTCRNIDVHVVNTIVDLSIHASIISVGLILTKLG